MADISKLRTVVGGIPTTINLTAAGNVLNAENFKLTDVAVTASKPLKLDANKKFTSGNIDLATEVTGNLPYSNMAIADADLSIAKTSGLQTALDGKLTKTLVDGKVFIGNGSNIATAQTVSGDVTISNIGVTAIGSGVIINDDVKSDAAIALTKLAATTISRALVSDGSGVISVATTTAAEIGYVSGVTSSIQTQLGTKLNLSGGTMSGAIAMGGSKVTGLGDGSANGDAVNYAQLQSAVAQSKLWKEVLITSSQLLNGASGGIYAAQAIVLSANFQAGDTITLFDGTNTENFIADTDFAVGGSISATLANLKTVINAGAIAISATTGLLDSLDPVNDVLAIWQDTIGESTRIYGNAGAALRTTILPATNTYEAMTAGLVALPTSQPVGTNFGFSRAKGSLVNNETHQCRVEDISYTWDSDAEQWNNSGSSSIPLATKVLAGKAQVGDGIAVAGGVISADVDTTKGLSLAGTSPNKKITPVVNSTRMQFTANEFDVKEAGIDHANLNNLNSATYTHLSATNHTDLTDSGASALHYHTSDRDRANHSGTQTASTISDFAEVAQDSVAAAIAAGTHTGIAITYTDANDKFDFAAKYDNSTVGIDGSNQLYVKATGITDVQLASNAVTKAKVADNAVGAAEFELENNTNMVGRNAAGDADVNILKINATDHVEMASLFYTPSAAPTQNYEVANKKYVDDQIALSSPEQIDFSAIAGESFSANTTYIVRRPLNGETIGRVYKATSDHQNAANKYWAIGFIQPTSAVSAGDTVTVIKFKKNAKLLSGDANFAAATDDGLPLFLNKAGAFSTNPDAGITSGELYASFPVGIQNSYNATVTDSELTIDVSVGGFLGLDLGA